MNRDVLIRKIQIYLISRGYSDARKGSLGSIIADFILEDYVHKDAFLPLTKLDSKEKDVKKIKEALQQSFDNSRIDLVDGVING